MPQIQQRTQLSPFEVRFHVDTEQMREGLVVFDFATWDNGLPESKSDDGSFFDEGQTDRWGWDL